MTAFPAAQRLRLLPGRFAVEHLAGDAARVPGGDWLAVVRAPEGLTVVRPLGPGEETAPEQWAALYGGDTAHAVDVPGMLAALLVPLAAVGIPVFVASAFHADVVLVPVERLPQAEAALRAAGHEVGSPH
ncbi:ACT domain-containing protein [Streptomyces sp. NRRL S-350]|uniref:ACT domain-containing protein n=1 Tax=Streptomyces sp. NRRL S-350 TaxID=1463902 RepID=UPI0004C0D6A4|nr:ACT domain-containing protein [Streptomyces sp. NRRL S-350]